MAERGRHDGDGDEPLSEAEREALLGAWPGAEPPAGFAERVVAAHTQGGAGEPAREASLAAPVGTPSPPRRRGALALLLVAGVAAALALFALTRRAGQTPRPELQGVLDTAERRQVDIGGRAVAVAEPGAALTWKVAADGSARITQSRGNVFYRVEKGREFVVETPAGEVRVLGTCFRVEVEPMGPKTKSLVSAGAGAALTAAVLVTVYEGRVRASNAQGRMDVHPGEVARLAEGAPPVAVASGAATAPGQAGGPPAAELIAPPAANATREELLARDRRQRETIVQLDERVRQLEAQVRSGGPVAKKTGLSDDGDEGPGGAKMFDITPEEWAKMAEQCEIRYAIPSLEREPKQVTPRIAEEAGLAPEEIAPINELLRRHHDRIVAGIRALYVEATGDTQGAETLDPRAMITEIEGKSHGNDESEARRRIALEKAGKVAPPADLSTLPPIARLLRLLVDYGDQVEADLAKVVGPERAREYRKKMSGSRSVMNGCSDPDKP